MRSKTWFRWPCYRSGEACATVGRRWTFDRSRGARVRQADERSGSRHASGNGGRWRPFSRATGNPGWLHTDRLARRGSQRRGGHPADHRMVRGGKHPGRPSPTMTRPCQSGRRSRASAASGAARRLDRPRDRGQPRQGGEANWGWNLHRVPERGRCRALRHRGAERYGRAQFRTARAYGISAAKIARIRAKRAATGLVI